MGKIIKLPGNQATMTRECTLCDPRHGGARVLGIDPGSAKIGYGVVDLDEQLAPTMVSYGIIQTETGASAPVRLQQLYTDLQELFVHFEPDVAVVEQLFFFRNVTTAMGVAQSRGV